MSDKATIKKTGIFITNERMLQFMRYCIDNHVAGVTSAKDWCARIGYHAANIADVHKGSKGFTVLQIKAAIEQYDLNVEWLFGVGSGMFRAGRRNLYPKRHKTRCVPSDVGIWVARYAG